MYSVVSNVLSPFVSCTVTPLIQQVGYLFNAGANVRKLAEIFVELNLTKAEVQENIFNAAAASDEMVPTERVKEWMKKVQDIEDVRRKIDEDYNHRKTCLGGCPINCWSSYRIGKRAAKGALKAKELINKQQSFDVLMKRSAPVVRRIITLHDATPSTTELYLEKALSYLQDDQAEMVGIWGMGGVGKTTLLQRINNHPSVEDAGFDYVIWIVASQDLNLDKLQKDIAERVGLTVDATLPVESRAQKLYHYLKIKKFLLLLDDIWDPLDLARLGIPCRSVSDGVLPESKVVFTTRSEMVCDQMTTYQKIHVRCKKIKIDCLQPEEAWEFFLDRIGEGMRSIINSDKRVCSRAAKVAEECGGLPLALVVIAQAMSGNKTWQEWEDAINSLNRIGIQEMWRKGSDPFPLLKVSYDRLPDDRVKNCFLCCALWPEDHAIWESDLIPGWVGMNLIDDCGDFSATYNRGHAIIQRLKRACLLEEVPNFAAPSVKMHDVIRGMALWIISDCKKWIIRNRAKLKDKSEDAMEWREAKVISLMYGRSGTLPQHPDWPSLSSLILRENSINVIPQGFFQNMHSLTFLDLSHNEISELPPAIGSLLQLRHLDLCDTSICSLPTELGNLTELQRLYLTNSENLESIPRGLISRLQKLEQLCISNIAFDGWDTEGQASIEEVVQSKIKSLDFDFRRLETMEQLSKNPSITLRAIALRDLESLTSFSLQSLLRIGNSRCTLLHLLIWDCDSLEELSIGSQCEEEFDSLERFELRDLHSLKKITLAGAGSGSLLRNIRFLRIEGCAKLKNATWILQLPYLESLQIRFCYKMEHVISNEESSSDGVAPETIVQENLKSLGLGGLPELHSYSTSAVAFPSLKKVVIYRCPKLDEAPFSHLKIQRRGTWF